MKKLFILFSVLFAASVTYAQCPQYLAFDTTVCGTAISKTIDAGILESRLCGDTFTVVFNDSTTALNGATQVYFHSGPEFRPFTGWQGQYTVDTGNSTAGLMTHIGPHLWSISFNPHTYYGFSPDSCLNSIAFGFRDANYNNYVKCGGSDIYVVTASGTAVNTCSSTFFTATYTHSTNISYLWSDGNTSNPRTFTTGGDFTVTATGVGGCTATGTVKINLDNRHVSIGPDTIECGTATYVFVATPGFATYQWVNGPVSTPNTRQAFQPGEYWVQAIDSNGCVSNDTASVHLSATGYLSLPASLSSCPGIPVSADASVTINANGDSLVIIYDATKGQTQLIGDTNVYMHSGPEFYPFQGWVGSYTVGNYGQNDGVGRMTSLGNNKWRIAIDPQSYYRFPPDTPLNSIGMIFRNFDGTKTGKDSLGNNIYVVTATNPPTCSFDGVTPSRTARLPLSYDWNDGVTTAARSFTTGGTYKVTVTDGVCTHSDSIVINLSGSATINIGNDTTVCGTTQHVIINAGAGYAHYAWSTGDTTQTINVVNPATYTVTVSTNTGCTSVGTRRVGTSTHAVSLGADITRCSTAATTLTATPGFASYAWINNTPASSATFTAVHAGSYWVTALDSAGCASYDTVRVINSPVVNLSLTDSIISCPGTSVAVDASTSITQNGDSLIIIYDATKHGSADSLVGASKVYMHSGPEFYPFGGWVGAYTVGNYGQDDGVGEMDSLGNNLWRIAIIPQQYYRFSPDTPLNGIWMIFRNANGSHTGKDYNNANIFVYTAVTPPTSSFAGVTASRKAADGTTYGWVTPTGTASGPAISVDTTGLYIATATNGACSKSDTIHAVFSSSTTLNISGLASFCAGDSTTITAGAGFTHYIWSNGDTTRSITVHTAATYSVTATNGTGCSSTGQKSVTISTPVVSLGADIVKCDSSAAILTATAGFASYQWIEEPATSSHTFSATKTGSYWVVATDSFGCVAQDTVTVRYSEVLLASLPDTVSSCPGNYVSLSPGTNISIYGDSIRIFYDATQGQSGLIGAHKVYMHSGPEFFPFQGWQGNYTVGNWGQDDGVGEMDSLGNNRWMITIFPQAYYRYSPDTPLNGIWMVFRNADGSQTGKDNTGNNIFLGLSTPTPTSSFSGVTGIHIPAGTITYAWSDGNTAPSIAVDSSGRYTVTVSDGACSRIDSTYVNLSSNLTINIGRDTAICSSGQAIFNAGSGFSRYRWSNGDTTQTITVSVAGSYSVTVTSPFGCTATDTVRLSINGTRVNAGADITRCSKSTPATLTASAGYVQYEWFGTGTSSRTYSAVNDGCYWVEATDSAGCTSYDTVCVSTTGIEALHSRDTLGSCVGRTVSIDPSVEINAAGDSLVIIFNANQNVNSAPLLGASKVYMHSAPQFYPFAPWSTAQYTVGNWGQDDGIGEMDSIGPNIWRITIFPSGYYHFNPDTPFNAIWMLFRNASGTAENAGGNINLYVAGGDTATSPYAGLTGYHKSDNVTYTWSNGATTGLDSFSTPGTYYLTATDGSCTKIDTVLVNQSGNPVIAALPDTCLTAGTVTLSAGAGFADYVWSTGASTQTILVSHAGTYWIRVANAAGCTASDTLTVDSSCGTVVTPPGNCSSTAYFRAIAIAPDNQVTFKDSSTNAIYFTWIFGDNSSVRDTGTGSTVHTYANSGVYTVMEIVQASDTCQPDTIIRIIYVNSTGIREITGINAVNLFPNPASNICTIDISATASLYLTVEIDNIAGARVSSRSWQLTGGDNRLDMDVSSMASGMYTVVLRSASGSVTKN